MLDKRPDLTPRQHQALDYIIAYTAEHGMPPTVREIADHLGIAPGPTGNHLRRLVAKHYLVIEPATHRGIRVLAGAAAASDESSAP